MVRPTGLPYFCPNTEWWQKCYPCPEHPGMLRQPNLPEHTLWREPGGRKGAVGEEMTEGTARCTQERKDSSRSKAWVWPKCEEVLSPQKPMKDKKNRLRQ